MKKIISLLTAAIMLISLSACNGDQDSSTSTSSVQSASSSEAEAPVSEAPVSSETESADVSQPAQGTDISTRVAALKGPTAMGIVHMMEEDYGTGAYSFSLAASPDEVTPLVVQGEIDIACVPANLASVIYQKTEGKISVISINTLGVLYIVENGDSIQTAEDLRGKTIFASGKGATPEYALNYFLTQNGLEPETDVTVVYKSEHAECVSALATTENAVAMLPEPFVTTARSKNEAIQVRLDLTAEWEKLADANGNPATLVTGVTIVHNDFLEAHPDLVDTFLQQQAASTTAVNADPAAAALLIEQFGITSADVAETAIPNCNITCITGEDMKAALSSYLSILHQQNPQAVGGALPDEAFYYQAP